MTLVQPVLTNARCFNCDYLLRNLEDPRCPECGRPFDPERSETVNATHRPLGWRRLLLCPPGIPLTMIALAALLLPVWRARSPGHQFSSLMSLIFYSLLAIAAWLIRLVARAVVVNRFSYPSDLARPGRWRWFLTPFMLLIAWLIPLNSITEFSFWHSRIALEDYARKVKGNPTTSWPARRVGLLYVKVAEASPGMVRFFCNFGYDGARCGYIYSPTTAPTNPDPTGNFVVYPLGGPWYEYYDSTWPIPAVSPAVTTAPAAIGK